MSMGTTCILGMFRSSSLLPRLGSLNMTGGEEVDDLESLGGA